MRYCDYAIEAAAKGLYFSRDLGSASRFAYSCQDIAIGIEDRFRVQYWLGVQEI